MIRVALLASAALALAALALAACSGEGGSGADKAASAAPPVAAEPGPLTGAGFVTAVAQGNLFEVQASRMARTRASDIEVKRFAQEMMDVHTASTAELSTLIAEVEGARIPVSPDARHQALLQTLRAASAADFQRLYLTQQADAHREARTRLETYASGGDNDGLKTFATKTATVVKAHVDKLGKLNPPA